MKSYQDSIPGAAAPFAKLIQEFNKLPGIGPKSAQRLTYHIVRLPIEEVEALSESLLGVKNNIVFCARCQNISEKDPCAICGNPNRDSNTICIVEEPLDILALERARCFNGLYHVLHGIISPINGIGPNDLKIRELLDRMKHEDITEIIIATNPTIEGEATAMYIQRLISPLEIPITRLARGLPAGGDLEYADEDTLTKAFQGRQSL